MSIIPIEYYVSLFFQFLLIITILIAIQGNQLFESSENLNSKKSLGIFVLIFTLIYIGLRPVSFRFGDMVIYDKIYTSYVNGAKPLYLKDVLFDFFLYSFSRFTTVGFFFFFCAVLYIIPLYLATKKMFKDYWFYGFFMLIISFSFWSYGTNGIRNGIATSLFIYALSKDKKKIIITILIASTFIHKSMFLPLVGYVITLFYNKPKIFLYFWVIAIPLSLALGGYFTSFFLSSGLIEEKSVTGYLGEFNQVAEGVELKVGFRWDFLLYSASGVFAGWYFIFKKKFKDRLYFHLFNTYLFVNAFWILVIRANYSNRFAYLSWFMLGIIIIYPLLKNKFFTNQHQVVIRIVLSYFAFTYLMNVILS